MNPMTNIKNLQKINERELELGIIGKKSWHDEFKDSAWLFIGGLPYDLSEGDIICVFSQYGEPVNFNLVRDHKTGKSKGFAFLCYEDQRSTILSVDNLNGIKILGRTIRVEHVKEYKIPKEHKDDTDFAKKMREYGCGPKAQSSSEEEIDDPIEHQPKSKKDKKAVKKKKKKKRESSSSSSSDSSDDSERESKKKRKKERKVKEQKFDGSFIKREIKEEKHDLGYEKAANSLKYNSSNQFKSEGERYRNSERDLSEGKSKDRKRLRDRSNDSRDRRKDRSHSRERRRERSRSRGHENKGSYSRERYRDRSDSRERKKNRSYMNGRDR